MPKITDYPEMTVPDDGDMLVIEDLGAANTKKVSRESLLAGAPLPPDTVDTQAVQDGAVTSTKLAEAFFRGKYQAITTNTQPTGLTVQFGWSYVVGDGTTAIEKAIVFPTAFASAPFMVFTTLLGAKSTASGAPTDITEFITANVNIPSVAPDDITANGFTAQLTSSVNYNASYNYGFQWMAIGTV